MEPGESSGEKEELWAKLVPTDPRYTDVEIRSKDTVICSEITDSSSEKHEWCRITWGSDRYAATIRNTSSHAIVVNGSIVGEEAVGITSGSEIIAGPNRKGYLSYTFESVPSEEHDRTSVKISFDVDHAKCSICLNIWHDVVSVSPCLHNFCNGCFSEWARSSSQSRDKHRSVVCPQCRASVHSAGRNHFLHNIEEAILQEFSSLKRSDTEIAMLDTHASIKPNLVFGMQKSKSRKRPLSSSSDESSGTELPCPQCDTELGGFRCSRTTAHILCQGCGGMMPSRPDIGVPQHCLGCDRAFCGAYWSIQGVDASEFNTICGHETFKPISEHTVSRIPDSAHHCNLYERDVTENCIQHTGKTLQAVISEWLIKFDNREIDRTMLEINHAETITTRTHVCNDCFSKLVDFLLYWFRIAMPKYLLPPIASEREDCWYGYLCRTQRHNVEHARKRNHVCRPTRGPLNQR